MAGIHTFRSARFRRLFKESSWIVIGQAAAVIGALVGVRLLTELLDPTAYGELALGITLAALVNQTILGPLASGVTRYYSPALQRGDLRGYLDAVRRMVFGATGLILLAMMLTVAGLLLAGRLDWIGITSAALIFAILSGYNSILSGIQNAARQRAIVALHQGMESWARFLVAAGLLLWLGATSTVAMVGYAMGVILVLGSQYVFFRKILPNQITETGKESNWGEQIWKYSWPMAVTGVTSWGLLASQRWALELFAGTEAVGYFSAIFQIGFTPFMLAGGIVMTLMTPIFFARAGDGLDKGKVDVVTGSIVKFCFVSFLIVLISTALGAVFHDTIFRLLVAKEYRAFSHYLPFAILAGGMLQVSLFLATIILVSTRTRIFLPINTIGNFVIAAINLFSTYLFGMDGLFVAMVIGSAIHLTWNIYNAWKVSHHD